MNFSYIRKLIKISIGATEGLVQQRFLAIANFVVNSRLRFARSFIFNRKYKVPNFATDEKPRNVKLSKNPFPFITLFLKQSTLFIWWFGDFFVDSLL